MGFCWVAGPESNELEMFVSSKWEVDNSKDLVGSTRAFRLQDIGVAKSALLGNLCFSSEFYSAAAMRCT